MGRKGKTKVNNELLKSLEYDRRDYFGGSITSNVKVKTIRAQDHPTETLTKINKIEDNCSHSERITSYFLSRIRSADTISSQKFRKLEQSRREQLYELSLDVLVQNLKHLSFKCSMCVAKNLNSVDKSYLKSIISILPRSNSSVMSVVSSYFNTMNDETIECFGGATDIQEMMVGSNVSDVGFKSFLLSYNLSIFNDHLSDLKVESWEDINTSRDEDIFESTKLKKLTLLGSRISIGILNDNTSVFMNLEHLILHDISFSYSSFDKYHECISLCDNILQAISIGFRKLNVLELSCCLWTNAISLYRWVQTLSTRSGGNISFLLQEVKIVGFCNFSPRSIYVPIDESELQPSSSTASIVENEFTDSNKLIQIYESYLHILLSFSDMI